MNDWELLRQFVDQGSRESLDALVERHLAMVYAAALREAGDANLAQDITQAVFLVLLRRAPSLAKNRYVLLAGWLFQVVHFTAADARKAAARRQHHEHQAAEMRSETLENQDDAEAHRLITPGLVPLLNDAIASLGTRDRDAVVMCYLQGRSHREVAEAQQASENAVRQRLFRAMGKLRSALRRRGADVSPTVIAAALSQAAAEAAHSVPPGLAASVGSALGAAHAAGHSAILANAMIRSIYMLKVKMTVAACVAVLFLSAGAGYVAHALATDGPAPVQLADAAPATAPPAAPPAPNMAPDTAPAAPATQPTTAPGPAAEPKETVRNVFADIEAGNADAMISCFDNPSADDIKTLKTVVHVLSTATELRKAVVAKFGQDAGDKVITAFGGGVMASKLLDGLPVTVTGDKAEIGQGDGALHLVKVGDVWKLGGAPGADKITQAAPFFDNLEQVLPDVKTMIADVKAGKYANADDLQDAVQDLVSPKPNPGM